MRAKIVSYITQDATVYNPFMQGLITYIPIILLWPAYV